VAWLFGPEEPFFLRLFFSAQYLETARVASFTHFSSSPSFKMVLVQKYCAPPLEVSGGLEQAQFDEEP